MVFLVAWHTGVDLPTAQLRHSPQPLACALRIRSFTYRSLLHERTGEKAQAAEAVQR